MVQGVFLDQGGDEVLGVLGFGAFACALKFGIGMLSL